jgi:hypothetical protein
MLELWLGTGRTHKLAIGLASQWVWDYQLDGFVHHSESDAPDSPTKAAAPTGRSEGSARAADIDGGRARFAPVEPGGAHAAVVTPGTASVADKLAGVGNGSDVLVRAAAASATVAGVEGAGGLSNGVDQDFLADVKAEQMTTEYVGLLSSQLESQRRYFAETTARVVAAARAKAETIRRDTMAAQRACAELEATLAESTAALDVAVGAQRVSAERLSAAFSALRAERSRCQSLMAEQAGWQVRWEMHRCVATLCHFISLTMRPAPPPPPPPSAAASAMCVVGRACG